MTRRSPYPSMFARLVANSEQEDEDNPLACWVWLGKVRSGGNMLYGHINIWRDHRHLTVKVHRLMMEETLGRPLRPGAEVDHLYHNSLCINPNHLREVTPKENLSNRRGYRKVTAPSPTSSSNPGSD